MSRPPSNLSVLVQGIIFGVLLTIVTVLLKEKQDEGDIPTVTLDPLGPFQVTTGNNLEFTAVGRVEGNPLADLVFSLVGSAQLPFSFIHPQTGEFSWTPTQPGTFTVLVRVSVFGFSSAQDEQTVVITADPLLIGDPPVFSPSPGGLQAARVGEEYSLTLQAFDSGSPQSVMTYLVENILSPPLLFPTVDTLTINPTSGALTWTPPQSGHFSFDVVATNAQNLEARERVLLTVEMSPAGDPPTLAPIGTLLVQVGSPVTFTAQASPPAGSVLFSLENPSSVLIPGIDAASGLFHWVPSGVGTFRAVVVALDTSTGLRATQSVVIVSKAAPVLDQIIDQTGAVGYPITFTATATDADAVVPDLLFSMEAVSGYVLPPPPASLDPVTGIFLWPSPALEGSYGFDVVVRDEGDLEDRQTVVVVVNANVAPVLSPIGDLFVLAGNTLAFTATADAGGVPGGLVFDIESAQMQTLPPIHPTSGAFEWVTIAGSPTTVFSMDVVVSNMFGLQSRETVSVTLAGDVVVEPVSDIVLQVGESVALTLAASNGIGPFVFGLGTPVPTGVTVDPASGLLEWTPQASDIGAVNTTAVRVTDTATGHTSADLAFNIAVYQGMTLTSTPSSSNVNVTAGVLTQFQVSVVSGGTPAFVFSSGNDLPSGATFSPTTGVFEWTPAEWQAGTHVFQLICVDSLSEISTLDCSLVVSSV